MLYLFYPVCYFFSEDDLEENDNKSRKYEQPTNDLQTEMMDGEEQTDKTGEKLSEGEEINYL